MDNDPDGPALTDGAIDALAGILRSTGRYAFELDDGRHEEFVEACEAWVRHVTMGAPVLPGAPEGGTPAQRAWGDLGLFYRDRRRSEQSFVNSRLAAFRGIIWQLVDGLRVLSQSGASTEAAIHESLRQLERAVDTESLENVRKAFSRAVGDINSALRRRREEMDNQLHRMSSRMESMREDLLSARRATELDPLTRLYNRGAFDDALRRYVDLASLSNQQLALMMIDLDHFKSINDVHGHQCGDQVIIAAAHSLTRTLLRKNDFVARYGGEEYAAILLDTGLEHARPLAERLRIRMTELGVTAAGKSVAVTCSIGFAVLLPDDTPDRLLARADAALYRAKAAGRNRVEQG